MFIPLLYLFYFGKKLSTDNHPPKIAYTDVLFKKHVKLFLVAANSTHFSFEKFHKTAYFDVVRILFAKTMLYFVIPHSSYQGFENLSLHIYNIV